MKNRGKQLSRSRNTFDGKEAFTEYIIAPTLDSLKRAVWDKFYRVMNWPNLPPPEGAMVIRTDEGSELCYWPTPPFDISREPIKTWIKWKMIALPQGYHIKMLVFRNPGQNLADRKIDWSIGNFTNDNLWLNKINREREESIEQKDPKLDTLEVDPTSGQWMGRKNLETAGTFGRLKKDLNKSLRGITRNLEQKLGTIISKEISGNSDRKEILKAMGMVMRTIPQNDSTARTMPRHDDGWEESGQNVYEDTWD